MSQRVWWFDLGLVVTALCMFGVRGALAVCLILIVLDLLIWLLP